jgi:hypothetical protein
VCISVFCPFKPRFFGYRIHPKLNHTQQYRAQTNPKLKIKQLSGMKTKLENPFNTCYEDATSNVEVVGHLQVEI